MATTTATITLSSADLTGDALALSTTATLTKSGGQTGLDQTTGIAVKKFTNSNAQTILSASDYTNDRAHKVYLKNNSSVSSENFKVVIGSTDLGKIFAGDWAFIPWMGESDIKVTPSVPTETVIEYAVFSDNT
jgi:hypothetical protein